MSETATRPTFTQVMEKHGWASVTLTEHLGFTPMGGSTWRRGFVRAELTAQTLTDRDFTVSFYINTGESAGTISAIVVDHPHRGAGHGHDALVSLLAVLDELGWDKVYVEARPIKRRGISPCKMGQEALFHWYKRHGFKPRPRYNRDGSIDADSNTVLMRERPAISN